MVAGDFLQDPQVRKWLVGVEPAWTLLTFESLRALRQEPSAAQTAIRIANNLSADDGRREARNELAEIDKKPEEIELHRDRARAPLTSRRTSVRAKLRQQASKLGKGLGHRR
jgi:hypothetical protein